MITVVSVYYPQLLAMTTLTLVTVTVMVTMPPPPIMVRVIAATVISIWNME